jgi:L-fuculose-phosphate aldolase
MLGHLSEQDLINSSIEGNDKLSELASTELSVHRSIYKHTPSSAVVHAHPPHATALSFLTDCIVPADLEGSFILSKIPVLGQNLRTISGDLSEEIALSLTIHKAVLVFGHGSFAAGKTLEEAHHWTSTLEASCEILHLKNLYNVKIDSENKSC